ncbi:MAG TPA: hypothetical protein VFN67_34850 [Polyangiales bacterium]|jgi:hypothetical protein|nr:hypothetical protein [Polyangiales bacterium]
MDIARRQLQLQPELAALSGPQLNRRAFTLREQRSFQAQRQRYHVVRHDSLIREVDRLRLLRRQPDHALHECPKIGDIARAPQPQLTRSLQAREQLSLTPFSQKLAQNAHPCVVYGACLHIPHTRDDRTLALVAQWGWGLSRAAQPFRLSGC